MAFITNVSGKSWWENKNPVDLRCDKCGKEFKLLFKSAKKNEKKNNGNHVCAVCKGVPLKPQNKSLYWTQEKREQHGLSIKNSTAYQSALEHRDTKNENNGMYGKNHCEKSKQKMSVSRIGKTGPNATAWKGGKSSLLKRVKGIVHRRHHWYEFVFQRDQWRCVQCDSKENIDAHHIEPMTKIVKRLCESRLFDSEEDKFNWLTQQPDVIDVGLKNGITLCRKCHKEIHENWGSHNG